MKREIRIVIVLNVDTNKVTVSGPDVSRELYLEILGAAKRTVIEFDEKKKKPGLYTV